VAVGASVEHPAITSWATGDPRLRFLTLDGVHVSRAAKLAADGAAQELVRTADGALVVDASAPGRTATLVGFDVGESDWPLKASFVLFVRNVVEQARTHRAHGITGPVRVGEPMRLTLPPSATTLKVDGPGDASREVPVRSGLAVVADVERAGLYHVSWQGARPGSAFVAANLTSDRESDLRTRPLAIEKGEGTIAAADRVADAHTEWTWLLAALALAMLVLDVLWLTRKPRIARAAAKAVPKLPDRRPA
jgi:hypothetical protein